MKRNLRPPRFLPEVLRAITDLREVSGSRSSKIISHVKASLSSPFYQQRNISAQVKRALNHATLSGILMQRAGKFRINPALIDPSRDCSECSRRKRRYLERKRRTRRRGKKRHGSLGILSDSDSYDGLPVREARRRRRKTPVKRRRRRRRAPKEPSIKPQPEEEYTQEIVYPDDHTIGESGQDGQCDNPNCLCNVKDEVEEPPPMDSTE